MALRHAARVSGLFVAGTIAVRRRAPKRVATLPQDAVTRLGTGGRVLPVNVAALPTTRALQVYGLDLQIEGDWPEVVDSVAKDFAWFTTDAAAAGAERVVVERRAPDFDAPSGSTYETGLLCA